MYRKIIYLLSIIVFFAAGCTMAPQYSRPDVPVPSEWPTGPAYQETKIDSTAKTAAELPWREFITDERLRKVIETALHNNRDIRIAALNVERARAYYGIQRAELLPSINGIGSMYKERTPADLSSSGSPYTAEKHDVNLGIASWEIDFFGRIRSLKDNALEQYLATDQACRSAQLMMISSTVQVYLSLAADKEVLQLVTSTLNTQESLYNLIKKRADAGIASELDLRRAQSQVDNARGDVALYTQRVTQDENALNLLVGSPVSREFLPVDLKSVIPPREISAGLLSNILLSRPDILAAEHQLKAANANIGAARAAFFPRITLTASAGTASDELSGLFKTGSGTWMFSPQIIMPIFDARTWHAYDVTQIEKEISIAEYEKAIQTAFREVADALAEKGTIIQRVAAQQSLVDALQETYRLSQIRYEKGVDSYLSVLDAQRSLYSAQQGLILLHLAQNSNLITLYKTLGGGEDKKTDQ
ncbi:MAG: efflux transporter outer membrane subunit [Syntrophaceae bacterium]|nr:efflux transporter outer membrane subunit [Syntrophaceae bacterium]